MHAELHDFLSRLIGTAVLALAPVVFTAFVSVPLNLNGHPAEPVALKLEPRHMT